MKKLIYLLFFIVFAISVVANPQLNPISTFTVDEGACSNLDFVHTAADNGSTSYTLSPHPDYITVTSISDTQGRLSICPDMNDAGAVFVVIKAEDADSSSTTQAVIKINEVDNINFEITNAILLNGTQGSIVSDTFMVKNRGNFVDQINLSVESDYTLTLNPTELVSLNRNEGRSVTISGTIPSEFTGLQSVGKIKIERGDYVYEKDIFVNAISNNNNNDNDNNDNDDNDDNNNNDNNDNDNNNNDISDTASLTLNEITIGNEDAFRNRDHTSTLTITNNGTQDLDVTLSFNSINSPATTKESEFNIRFNPSTLSIAQGESAQVEVTGFIPLDFDAVDSNLDNYVFKIGTIKAESNSYLKQVNLNMQAINQLDIKKAYFCLDDECEKFKEDDDINDIKPGDEALVKVEVENNFDNDDRDDDLTGDIDINDIDVRIEIDHSDLDIDESEEIEDLSGKDEDEVEINFDIDEDADDGNYDMILSVSGMDDNNARHGLKYTPELEVVRKKHEVAIRRLTFSPSRLSCSQATELRILIENTGKRDENDVVVKIENSDLGISKYKDEIELDRDDEKTITVPIRIPDNKYGSFNFLVRTFYNGDELSQEQTATIVIEECNPTPTTNPSNYIPSNNIPSGMVIQPQQSTIETSESPVYNGILISTIILVGIGIIFLLINLVKKF